MLKILIRRVVSNPTRSFNNDYIAKNHEVEAMFHAYKSLQMQITTSYIQFNKNNEHLRLLLLLFKVNTVPNLLTRGKPYHLRDNQGTEDYSLPPS